MKLKISDDLSLPEDVASQTSAILGIRGSGKSTTATVLVEDLCESRRAFVWIDPLDVAWGLKSSRDGKRPGYPVVIAGGAHGDVPLAENDGATLADFVVEHSVPLILSLRHLRKAAQRRFVIDFAEQLYHRKGETKHRTALLVVIDECDSFIPQRVGGAEARMVGAIEDLVRRGRSAGLGVLLISQRAASINKDVLTQIELLVAHRHTSPQDRGALALWIEAHDTEDRETEFMGSLASLKRGEAWFWSPTLDLFKRVQVREPRTFDSRATPAPGQAHAAPKSLAEVDLDSIRSKLAKTIEQARADDPKELRKRIAELERQLKAKANSQDQVRTVQVPVLAPQLVTDLKDSVDTLISMSGELGVAAKVISDALSAFSKRHVSPLQNGVAGKKRAFVAGSVARPPSIPRQGRGTPSIADADALSKAERQILAAFYWTQGEPITPEKIAFYAQYTVSSGGFNNALSSLRTKGLLRGWSITEEGVAKAESLGTEAKPNGQQLREWLRPKLDRAQNTLLDALCAAHPERLDNAALASASGYTESSGGFNNALSRLRSIGAAEGYTRDGGARAADVFFE